MPYDKNIQIESLRRWLTPTINKEDHSFIYAIFHSATIDNLWFNLDFWGLEHASLMDGDEAEDLKTECGYLVKLDPEHESFQLLLQEFGNNNSLYIRSGKSLTQLLKKFKNQLHIYTEYGESALLLFYIPRIFRNYLPLTSDTRKASYLDGIESYYCESSMAYEIEVFERRENEFTHTIHAVEGYEYDEKTKPNFNTFVGYSNGARGLRS